MNEIAPDRPPPIAAAVIAYNGKVLLVKRRISEGALSWQFPAGGVEFGEQPEQAAARETQEETGLIVKASHVIGQRVHPATGRTMIYVACDYEGGAASVRDMDELSDFAWVDWASIGSYVSAGFHPPVQSYLERALLGAKSRTGEPDGGYSLLTLTSTFKVCAPFVGYA